MTAIRSKKKRAAKKPEPTPRVCACCGHAAYHCPASGCNATMPNGDWCDCEGWR